MNTLQALPPRGIVVTDLIIRRGLRTLILGLSATVTSGDVFVLFGANGSGKSSLILTLCGAARPQGGTVVINGREPHAGNDDMHLIGHGSAVKSALTVTENLRFWTDVYGGNPGAIASALEQVGLGGLGHLPAGYLSAGQMRRLALARLLVAPRPIWLLDEPTASLDEDGERLVGAMIDSHSAAGGVVVAATHHDLRLAETTTYSTLFLGGTATR